MQEFLADDGEDFDQFGSSVALSGDVALVGSYADNDFGSVSGSAYVFRYDGLGWFQEQELLPGDGDDGDVFGNSTAVNGDVAVIGAPSDEDNDSFSGSIYVVLTGSIT